VILLARRVARRERRLRSAPRRGRRLRRDPPRTPSPNYKHQKCSQGTKRDRRMARSARAAVRTSAVGCARVHKTADVCGPRCRRRQLAERIPLYCPRPRVVCDVRTPDAGATRLRAARGPLSGSGQSGPLYPGPRHSGRAHPPALATPAVRTLRPSPFRPRVVQTTRLRLSALPTEVLRPPVLQSAGLQASPRRPSVASGRP